MIIIGDALKELKGLEDKTVNCCVTSPPYWGLRDYGIPPTEWPEIEFSPMAGLSSIKIKAQGCCFGLENDPWSFVGHAVAIFREVSRVLRDDGTLWLNLGDSYSSNGGGDKLHGINKTNKGSAGNMYRSAPGSLKKKELVGLPWKVAFALQADGWYLRQDVIWHKPNPMPESVKDRCTKAHEYIFLMSKRSRYYFDQDAIKEPAIGGSEKIPAGWDTGSGSHNGKVGRYSRDTAYSFARKTATEGQPGAPKQHREDREDIEYSGTRNKRSVWTVSTKPYKEAHFATFPPDLIEPCILAGCPEGGIVIDPFGGSGTVGEVAKKNGRDFILIELNPDYKPLIDKRIDRAHYQKSF